MPGHYNMPAIPNRYPLDKNDKLGLAIGALLSGGLAAANSNRNMGENPLLRGIAGSVAGFGGGANQIQDSYSKMLDDYLKGEDMNFKNREFGQKVKEFEEADKPEKLARARWYDEREATPVDYNKIRDERTLRRLDIKRKQKELEGGGISGDKTTQQLLEEAINEGNAGGAINQPPRITIDQFLNEARKVNPGVSDDELTRYYNKKYGQ